MNRCTVCGATNVGAHQACLICSGALAPEVVPAAVPTPAVPPTPEPVYEPVYEQAPAYTPAQLPPPLPTFVPTHYIPAGGLPAWSIPDASFAPAAVLPPGLPVRWAAGSAGWAQVVCENGWEGWVFARFL